MAQIVELSIDTCASAPAGSGLSHAQWSDWSIARKQDVPSVPAGRRASGAVRGAPSGRVEPQVEPSGNAGRGPRQASAERPIRTVTHPLGFIRASYRSDYPGTARAPASSPVSASDSAQSRSCAASSFAAAAGSFARLFSK